MSWLPGEKLHYAETHFKFKLPWSFLYRPWPEIIVDAPFQFVKGSKPALWIVVRDGDHFPVTLEKIDVELVRTTGENTEAANTESTETISRTLDIEANEAFGFYRVELGELPAGTYKATATICVRHDGKKKRFARWNLPGLKPAPLRFQVLAEELPKPNGYAFGEMHCHTHYSSDHVEYGATPEVMQQAAKAVGLDFVNFTDHAYDFAFTDEDYTKEAETPVTKFQRLKEEIANLPRSPLLLAGEEVSAGNSKGENVHMTVLGPEGYLPGIGDCGRYWLDNKPTRRIDQILDMTTAPCFAAHPWQQMSALERFIFRRGYWHSEDLQMDRPHSIRGIQFWNGIRDEGFTLGRDWWIEELGKEHYLLPIAGNDAHGDLNDTTSVALPLISLRHSREHVFGKVRTAIYVGPDGEAASSGKTASCQQLSCEGLQKAFLGDNCFITDGPALWWERGNGALAFHARSNREMGGGFRYILIYGRRRLMNGKLAETEEVLKESLVAAPETADLRIPTAGFAYLRAECETATGRFALTSAAQL